MTEDEAKTKWCPFIRITPETENRHAVTNRELRALEPTGPVVTSCIGSACMAWRSTGEAMFRNAATGTLTDRDLTGHGEWVRPSGFCGLAGVPQ